jgi:hypothetical protein
VEKSTVAAQKGLTYWSKYSSSLLIHLSFATSVAEEIVILR